LNGVSNYDWHFFQFISLDGTRSAFDSSDIPKHLWKDHIVPQGKQIRTVETMLAKFNGHLEGFKWIGDDGAVLFASEFIDNPSRRNDPYLVVNSLTLNHNQRLVGVRSDSSGNKMAKHY
jgi:hypothetical protein